MLLYYSSLYQVYDVVDEDDDDENNMVEVVVQLDIVLNHDDTMIDPLVMMENMFDDDFF